MTASPVAAATVNFNPETRLFIDGRLRDSSTGKDRRERQPGQRRSAGVRHRRQCRGHAGGHRRRPPRVRHHRLVDQPRVPPTLPDAVARRAAGGKRGHPRRADRRSRRDSGDDLHRAVGMAAGRRDPVAGATHLGVHLGADARPGRQDGRAVQPRRGQGTDGCRRRHHAMELPVRDHQQQGGPDPGHREHDGAQTGHRDAVERAAVGPDHRREDRHPGRCRQHRPGVGQRHRPGARHRSRGSTWCRSPDQPRSASSSSGCPGTP